MNSPADTPRRSSPGRGPASWVGEVVDGNYRIDGVIARGSTGRVFRATQLRLDRVVALKILDPSDAAIATTDDSRSRFVREASILSKLTHPNTVRVFDFGVWEGRSFLVMEYVSGSTLKEVTRDQPLPAITALHIARQVCGSLREAHAQGVIHRDLKPGNILITEAHGDSAYAKVVDFGLVKEIEGTSDITGVGMALGTPMYMAPEQIRGLPLDARTDVYAIGMVLYRIITGHTPWPGNSTANVLMSHMTSEPPAFREVVPDLELAPAVEWLVLTCLQKRPDARFNNVEELDRALDFAETAIRSGSTAVPTLFEGRTILPGEALPTPVGRKPTVEATRGPPPWALPVAAGAGGALLAATALIVLLALVASFATRTGTPPESPIRNPRTEQAATPAEVPPPAPEAVPTETVPAPTTASPATTSRPSARAPELPSPRAPEPQSPSAPAPPPADPSFDPQTTDLVDPFAAPEERR